MVSLFSRQGGIRSLSLYLEMERLMVWAHQKGSSLVAQYLKGNLNVMAVMHSRPDCQSDRVDSCSSGSVTFVAIMGQTAPSSLRHQLYLSSPNLRYGKSFPSYSCGQGWKLTPFGFPPFLLNTRVLRKAMLSHNLLFLYKWEPQEFIKPGLG